MRLVLRPLVERDLDEAACWYETRQAGLRERFLGDFEAALVRVEENPFLYQTVHRAIRRAPLGDFPYGIFYVQIQDEIRVLGVVHDARHPSVWRRSR
jgi:toxin ParE1/3/4